MVQCLKIQQVTKLLKSWGFSVPTFSSTRECKVNLERLTTKNWFIARLSFYSNNSFHTLYSTYLHPGHEEAKGAEEDAAPAPVPALALLCQHSQLDQLVERFDRWEARFKNYIAI
ncbi:hypothetical protein MA16_Dca026071 [Dendrobium catenatum]|uniref:Uncharacterized protein n=1 Tax=Dendrobium catenatum TaxID=906689 RepID=A0A2I0VJM0_9ASPA|nr:hypothetical protein MA16_Dca026071 [Dendrobium catenatum]